MSSRIRKSATAAAFLCAVTGSFEGLQQTAYRDPVGIATICYGATKNVRMGMKATKAECDARLVADIIEHEEGLLKCGLRPDLPMRVHLSLVDLAFNAGVGAICKSTAFRKANAGDLIGTCNEQLRWVKAGGVTFRGLVRRRERLRNICLGNEAVPT